MKKKVVLIAPPRFEKEPDYFLPQNLGLGYIASYLESAGHQVSIIDALALGWRLRKFIKEYGVYIRGLPLKDIVERIPFDTDFVGITVPFASCLKIVRNLSYLIKQKYPKIITVIGGISPSVEPQDAFLEGGVDYAVRGAGEMPMLNIVSGTEPHKIKGLVYLKSSELVDNGRAECTENLDSLPFPARHLFPMKKYLSLSGRGRKDLKTTSVITSRGCPFDCAFCSIHHIYGYKWQGRSAKNVLDEISYLINEYNIEHIEFEDDNLTLDVKRANDIFEGLMNIKKRITWSTPNGIRIDTLDRRLLTKMKESGCTTLFLSIESGDPEILKIMNKQLDLEKVEEVVKICGELNINTSGIFMVGYPGETKDSFQKTVMYIRKLRKIGLVGVGASIAKAYPGTKLRQMCIEANLLIDKERYSRDIPTGEYVDIRTDYFSDEEIFYRLNYIKRRLNPLRFYTDIFCITKIIKTIFPQKTIDILKRKIHSLVK